jgi:hypothetical protein
VSPHHHLSLATSTVATATTDDDGHLAVVVTVVAPPRPPRWVYHRPYPPPCLGRIPRHPSYLPTTDTARHRARRHVTAPVEPTPTHYRLVHTRAPAQWPARDVHEGMEVDEHQREAGTAPTDTARGDGPLPRLHLPPHPATFVLNPSAVTSYCDTASLHGSFLRGGGSDPGIEFGGGI